MHESNTVNDCRPSSNTSISEARPDATAAATVVKYEDDNYTRGSASGNLVDAAVLSAFGLLPAAKTIS
jgi:hypothetical protein